MKTRTDYLAGKCTHHEYYSQFVTPSIVACVLRSIGDGAYLTRMYQADKNLGNIPLEKWDSIVLQDPSIGALDEQGTGKLYYSLSNGVCVLKTAARLIIEREKEL